MTAPLIGPQGQTWTPGSRGRRPKWVTDAMLGERRKAVAREWKGEAPAKPKAQTKAEQGTDPFATVEDCPAAGILAPSDLPDSIKAELERHYDHDGWGNFQDTYNREQQDYPAAVASAAFFFKAGFNAAARAVDAFLSEAPFEMLLNHYSDGHADITPNTLADMVNSAHNGMMQHEWEAFLERIGAKPCDK